ncbi:MAG: hypothetical protein JRI25_18200 [Deltaproteobacteria bacterium]|nr:hypothetical protein [Deltaproteobacteria bacterium]MBW2256509.1 hypothetical protein [Deltaproteobacteria bacterium]
MANRETNGVSETFPAHFALFILGGLCVGAGLLSLYWSFGWDGGALNSNYAATGFSGLDNISALDASDYSIPLVVVGISCLVYANAIAWRYTGGY